MDAPPTALPESTAHPQSHDTGQKCISDIRRTFCLFVTFDLLFVSLLWIIELNVNGKIKDRVVEEVLHFDYHSSFFDIFVLAVLRFLALILAYAAFKLHHWWVIAITTAITSVAVTVKVFFATSYWVTPPPVLLVSSKGTFTYLLPIISFILAWVETWILDFKVLPEEAETENRLLSIAVARMRPRLQHPTLHPDGQFYSPPESVADSGEDVVSDEDIGKEDQRLLV